MTARLLRLLGLVAVWVGLWGTVSVANVAWGVVVALTVTLAFPTPANGNGVRVLAAVRLLAVFARLLVLSTWQVIVEIVRPRPRLAEAVVAVDLAGRDPVIATVVANAISLTPGTLTVEIVADDDRPTRLYVHTLRLISVDDVRRSASELDALAAAAFPAAARRGVPHTERPNGGANQ